MDLKNEKNLERSGELCQWHSNNPRNPGHCSRLHGLDRRDDAVKLAFENGYPPEQAKLEPEFISLQSNPQFESLIQKLSAKK